MKTRKEVLENIHDQMLDLAIRAEIDSEFWQAMGIDPLTTLDKELRENVINQRKKNELSKVNRLKIIKIIEGKLKEA